MANCSIPNSIPANGRISTKSLGQSRKKNKKRRASISAIRRGAFSFRQRCQICHGESLLWRITALQNPLRAQRIQSAICNLISAIWRVKGAWWPSRSSKPSSSRKWRDRFDSYPLRRIIFELRFSIAMWSPPCGRYNGKGGDIDVP
jgi:hypothetical protein